jgi:hypothetical protein
MDETRIVDSQVDLTRPGAIQPKLRETIDSEVETVSAASRGWLRVQ